MRRITLLIILLALCLLAPSAASAASSDTILRDCVDGKIDGSYSRGALNDARGKIPSDVDEYSDCRGAIDQARVQGGSQSGDGNSTGSGSSNSNSNSSGSGGSNGGGSSGSGSNGSGSSGGSSGGGSSGGGSSGGGSSGAGSSSGGSSGGSSSGSGSSAASPATPTTVPPAVAATAQPAQPQGPSDKAVVDAALRRGGSGVRLNPETLVVPGSTGVPASESLRRSVPDPLLAVLIILGAVALVGAVLGTRARVVTRRLG